MSLILDALKKAEKERKGTTDGQSIIVDHGDEAFTAGNVSQRKPILIGLACFVMFFAVVLLVLSIIKSDRSHSEKKTSDRTSMIPEQARDTRAINTREEPKPETPPTKEAVSTTAITEDSKPETNNIDTSKRSATSLSSGLSNTSTTHNDAQKAINELYREQKINAKTNAEVEVEREPLPRPLVNQKTSSTRTNEQPSGIDNSDLLSGYDTIKHIKELPFSTQEGIPTLIYSQHEASDPANRFIVINGKSIRENASVTSGIRVEKILKDGVLMTLNGTKFKMRALNSWLNY